MQDYQVIEVRGQLEMWVVRLNVMAEQMRNAPFLDAAQDAQTSDAMEVDEAGVISNGGETVFPS